MFFRSIFNPFADIRTSPTFIPPLNLKKKIYVLKLKLKFLLKGIVLLLSINILFSICIIFHKKIVIFQQVKQDLLVFIDLSAFNFKILSTLPCLCIIPPSNISITISSLSIISNTNSNGPP